MTEEGIYQIACLVCGTLLLAVHLHVAGKGTKPSRGLSVVVLSLATALTLAGMIGSTTTAAVLGYIGSALVITLVLLVLGVL